MNHICSSLELSLTLVCFNPNILYVNVESRAYHIYLFPQLLALHSDFRFFRNPIYLAAFFVFFTTPFSTRLFKAHNCPFISRELSFKKLGFCSFTKLEMDFYVEFEIWFDIIEIILKKHSLVIFTLMIHYLFGPWINSNEIKF